MLSTRSYSISDLETETGFDRRTIVYYIHSGLLPKVGRRGPNTRYPESVMDRLRFIRGAKTMLDRGELPTVTLADIGRALNRLGPDQLADLLRRQLPVADVAPLFEAPADDPVPPAPAPATDSAATPQAGPAAPSAPSGSTPARGERRSYGLADAGIRERFRSPAPKNVEPSVPTGDAPALTPDDTHPRLPVLSLDAMPTSEPARSADAETSLGELLRQLELKATLGRGRLPPGAAEQWTEIPVTSRVYVSVRGLTTDDAPLADAVARRLKKALREP